MTKDNYEDKPYYCLLSYDNSGFLQYDNKYRKTDSSYFEYGRPIVEYAYDLIFECEVSEEKMIKRDILYGIFGAPIINKRVLGILKNICPDDFQAFPALIRNAKPKAVPFENRDYYVLNIAKSVDSVDRESSIFEIHPYKPTKISKVKKLVFKKGCMGDNHLARDKFWQREELISPTLMKVLKKEKVKGISFYKDEEYSGY